MRRFTILSLMGLVLILAVGLAALRGANEYWAGGLLLATPLLLSVALVGALCGRERSRAGRLGFATFGGAYFALAFLGLSDGNLAKLPTSKLLWLVHERVAGGQRFLVSFTTTQASSGGPPSVVTVNSTSVGTGAGAGSFQGSGQMFTLINSSAPLPPNRWRTLLPGAADYDAFQGVGHCLFALVSGWLGLIVARRFDRGSDRGRADAEPAMGGVAD